MPQLDLFGGLPEKPNPEKTKASKPSPKKEKTPPTVVALHPDLPRAPFQRTSATSKAAADSIRKISPTQRDRVLAYIQAAGNRGATDDEIVTALNMLIQTVTPRRGELRTQGWIIDSRRVRRTRTGRMGAVWIAIKKKEEKPEGTS